MKTHDILKYFPLPILTKTKPIEKVSNNIGLGKVLFLYKFKHSKPF